MVKNGAGGATKGMSGGTKPPQKKFFSILPPYKKIPATPLYSANMAARTVLLGKASWPW